MNKMEANINDLKKKIKISKFKRDAYSFLGQSEKVKENKKDIYDLETKLIKIKLDAVK